MHTNFLFLDGRRASTKERVVHLLLAELQGLPIRAVHARLGRSKRISYQGVRRALTELLDDGVLLKREKRYLIDPLWARRLREFSEEVYRHVVQGLEVSVVSDETARVSIQSLRELGYYLVGALQQRLPAEQRLLMRVGHLYFPFGNMAFRDQLRQALRSSCAKIKVCQPSMGDRLLAQWYRRHAHISYGRCRIDCDAVVFGDTVLQIYFPPALRRELDALYRARSLLSLRTIDRFVDLFYAQHRIEVTITKNPALAALIAEGF